MGILFSHILKFLEQHDVLPQEQYSSKGNSRIKTQNGKIINVELATSKSDTDSLISESASSDLEYNSSNNSEKISSSEESVAFDEEVQHTTTESKKHSRQIGWRLRKSSQRKRNLVPRSLRRLLQWLDCFSDKEEILVPCHYAGNTTPRLVKPRPQIINKQLETLRIISSAARVSIESRSKAPSKFASFTRLLIEFN